LSNKLITLASFILVVLLYSGCSENRDHQEDPDKKYTVEKLTVYDSRSNETPTEKEPASYLEQKRIEFTNRRNRFFDQYNIGKADDIHSALVQLYINQVPSDEGFIKAIEKINKRE